jgi:hypothetical protein
MTCSHFISQAEDAAYCGSYYIGYHMLHSTVILNSVEKVLIGSTDAISKGILLI